MRSIARELIPLPFCQLISRYTSSPGNRADCYAELIVSSPQVAETSPVLSIPISRRDGQAELASPGGLENNGMVDPPKVVTNPSSNRARLSLTLSMWPLQRCFHYDKPATAQHRYTDMQVPRSVSQLVTKFSCTVSVWYQTTFSPSLPVLCWSFKYIIAFYYDKCKKT